MKTITIQGASGVTEGVGISVIPCPESRGRMPYEDEEQAARDLGNALAELMPSWMLKEAISVMLDAIEQGYRAAGDDRRTAEIKQARALLRGG